MFPMMITQAYVPWIMAVGGLGAIAFSPVVGKLLDRFNCYVPLGLHVLILIAAYGFSIGYIYQHRLWFAFAAAWFFGMSDAVLNTMGAAMVMKDVASHVSGALARTCLTSFQFLHIACSFLFSKFDLWLFT